MMNNGIFPAANRRFRDHSPVHSARNFPNPVTREKGAEDAANQIRAIARFSSQRLILFGVLTQGVALPDGLQWQRHRPCGHQHLPWAIIFHPEWGSGFGAPRIKEN